MYLIIFTVVHETIDFKYKTSVYRTNDFDDIVHDALFGRTLFLADFNSC